MVYQLRKLARTAWHRLSTIRPTSAAGHELVARLERPRPLQGFIHQVDVKGWVAAPSLQTLKIVVRRGSRTLVELSPHDPRPDVAIDTAIEGQVGGFSVTLPSSAVGPGRLAWLKVLLIHHEDGQAHEHRLAAIPVMRLSGRRKQIPRHEYGRVWDRPKVSGSLGEARRSVCGTTNAEEYERSGLATTQDIVDKVGVTPADVVLEIGCGTGRVGAHMAARCEKWIGSDVSANMIRYAREALDSRSNVAFVQLDGSGLNGVPDTSVDVVYCTGVFMHLDEWDRFRYVQEAFRVLRPRGRVYFDNFSLTSEEGWALFASLAALDVSQRSANISKASTPAELDAYARHAGFSDVTSTVGSLWVTVTGHKP